MFLFLHASQGEGNRNGTGTSEVNEHPTLTYNSFAWSFWVDQGNEKD